MEGSNIGLHPSPTDDRSTTFPV